METLQAALTQPDAAARREALDALAARAKERQAGVELVPLLLPALEDADGGVRNAASTVLGWIAFRAERAEPTLQAPATRLLDDAEAMVRHDGAWILESLAERGAAYGAALPALVRNLGHAVSETRAAAAFALAAFAGAGHVDPGAVEPLRHLAATATDATEKRAAQAALEVIAP